MDILKRLRNTQKSEPAASILEKEIERLREELDIWKSVFPDIAPESVQPDRSLLEKEVERLREALKPFADVVKGNWSKQPDTMPMSYGFGSDKRFDLTLGDFRKARAALKGDE